MKVSEIINVIESFSPLGIQEKWDNSGLVTGSPDHEVESALLCLDITEEVLDEAFALGCKMIISHHPMVFSGLKNFSGNDMVSRLLRRAIKEDLIIYSAHTNLDQVAEGVSGGMAGRLGLINQEILVPRKNDLLKLVTFIPAKFLEEVSTAVFSAGAGNIGKYDSCGYSTDGTGSFRAGGDASPFTGKKGEIHNEEEKRFETILPRHLLDRVVKALIKSHPYEEVAYDVYSLENINTAMGLGVVGDLKEEINEREFIALVKDRFSCSCLRHTRLLGKNIKRVALLGGSGSEFLKHAVSSGADAYITADVKYHQFFEADGKLLLLDIGHYESENVAIETLNRLLLKKLTNFAVHLSKINTNPINYF